MRSVILGTAIVAAAATGVLGQQGRFRAEVDLVNVAVMVMDRQGNFISDLKPDDFALFEDGAQQQVTHFLRGDTDADALNLRLGLLFDTSGSMQEDIGLARTAAIRFLKELPEAHDITLVDFDTEVRVARYGLADSAAPDRAHPHAQDRRLDGALRRARHLSRRRARRWTAGRSWSSTPTAATPAARRPSPTSSTCSRRPTSSSTASASCSTSRRRCATSRSCACSSWPTSPAARRSSRPPRRRSTQVFDQIVVAGPRAVQPRLRLVQRRAGRDVAARSRCG